MPEAGVGGSLRSNCKGSSYTGWTPPLALLQWPRLWKVSDELIPLGPLEALSETRALSLEGCYEKQGGEWVLPGRSF